MTPNCYQGYSNIANMSDELFDIFFSGKVLDPDQTELVKQKVAKLFNADDALIAKLFSGKPAKIKKAVDMDTAIKYRVKFREMGAVVDIRPAKAQSETPPPPAPKPEPEPAPEPSPETNSPEISAPSAELNASLAIPGTLMDDAVPPPPADIDTSHLTASDANFGSLEEYAETVIPAPLPDTSGLDLDASAGPLDSTPEVPPLEVNTGDMAIDAFSGNLDDTPPPPPANIDTSKLSASEANSGSLEEFNARPDPEPIPDTSNLQLKD